jgi:hypothetical protein
MLVLCLTLATICTLQLSLSTGFYNGAQAEELARAAVAQFIAEQKQASDQGSLYELQQTDLRARYDGEAVFPDGAPTLPGQAEIHFDPHQPYFSTDNSRGSIAAAGWTDEGSLRQSVPPYAVSLIVNVTCGRTSAHYESIIQRRWPYVLMAGYPISLQGAPNWIDTSLQAFPPSTVNGNILTYTMPMSAQDPPPQRGFPMVVDNTLFEAFKQSLQSTTTTPSLVAVGGETVVGAQHLSSQGNLFKGNLDAESLMGLGGVTVYPSSAGTSPPNQFTGTVNSPVKLSDGLRRRFTSLLEPTCPTGTRQVTPDTLGDVVGTRYGKPFVLMNNDVVINGSAMSGFEYPLNSRFELDGSMGNHFFTYDDKGQKGYDTCPSNGKAHGLQLSNCLLYVDGDLELSSAVNSDDGTHVSPRPALTGDNVTLVVNGALTINNGVLQAGSTGMVIACRRLLLVAEGEFHGLILVSDTAVICPQTTMSGGTPPAPLVIRGAIICGGWPVTLGTVPGDDVLTVAAEGTALWSTDLEYDPKYLRTLNALGDYQLISVRRLAP